MTIARQFTANIRKKVMANQGSKGNKKRNSTLQKEHYKRHRFKVASNKITRLQRHIKRNLKEVERKANRTPPRTIKVDKQAANRLKALVS